MAYRIVTVANVAHKAYHVQHLEHVGFWLWKHDTWATVGGTQTFGPPEAWHFVAEEFSLEGAREYIRNAVSTARAIADNSKSMVIEVWPNGD